MSTKPSPLIIAGWSIFAHPLFLDQVQVLTNEVASLKEKNPATYQNKNAAKRLAAILKLAYEVIPQDPTLPVYRQGNTLGEDHKHWLRAKFFAQYRLFFRYHEASKIIVYVWVNDENTKRAYESKDDAYRVFSKMLGKGHPPDDWETLLKESKTQSN
ncbi:type II toxin-antitoxin system YhaV family toxin [Polynucleobacter brandtiae]|uniref:type II toxin-antitoxin system YhaV family toxin n=1 Tax=Polynucleobacter brandtiae TaxID=1938816 RepID=UPI003F6F1545